jgi:hypothetical protein
VDIRMPSETPCPQCGSRRYIRLRCTQCPAENIDRELEASGLSGLLNRATMLDLALRKGFAITLADITMEEWGALTFLWSEQDKYQGEELEARQRKMREGQNGVPTRYQSRPV